MNKYLKEYVEFWGKFTQTQKAAKKKIDARMSLWDEENPYEYGSGLTESMRYRLHLLKRDIYKDTLIKEFGYKEPTFENFLDFCAKELLDPTN